MLNLRNKKNTDKNIHNQDKSEPDIYTIQEEKLDLVAHKNIDHEKDNHNDNSGLKDDGKDI